MMAVYALLIFVAFALFGGLGVFFVIRNQPEPTDSDEPQRGVARGQDV